MMTKEEVAEIVSYCEEHKISYKKRLKELDIPLWKFYDSKRRYCPDNKNTNGELLQLINTGRFFTPNPIKASRSRRKTNQEQPSHLSVELKTPNGTLMRIEGEMSQSALQAIIRASSGDV
jgi:hypothetical protein